MLFGIKMEAPMGWLLTVLYVTSVTLKGVSFAAPGSRVFILGFGEWQACNNEIVSR